MAFVSAILRNEFDISNDDIPTDLERLIAEIIVINHAIMRFNKMGVRCLTYIKQSLQSLHMFQTFLTEIDIKDGKIQIPDKYKQQGFCKNRHSMFLRIQGIYLHSKAGIPTSKQLTQDIQENLEYLRSNQPIDWFKENPDAIKCLASILHYTCAYFWYFSL